MALTVRSFSADIEPLRLVERFPELYPGLLESSSVGRFDILPFSSGETLKLTAPGVLDGPFASTGKFLDALDQWWLALHSSLVAAPISRPELPFKGGWLLYLGYELAAEIEPHLNLPPSPDPMIAWAVRAPAAWIRDRLSMQSWLIAEPGCENLLNRFEQHIALLSTPSANASIVRDTPLTSIVHEEAGEKFEIAVRRALEYIAAGEVYQTNLSRLWSVQSSAIDPVKIYLQLRTQNPSPFAAILRQGDFSLLSSSPERLFCIIDGVVSTRPIAGTRPRGNSLDEDLTMVRTLLENAKERAEHVMLIDLERNDLGKVCRAGSVQVNEFMSVETYAHVHHIVSNISGTLGKEITPVAVIRALFPGGTITGCPKFRCMQIISELEGQGRGAYTGSLGYLNRDGSCDFNILIRTISVQGKTLRFRAGAGIVADSHPSLEVAETRAKAEGLRRALVIA